MPLERTKDAEAALREEIQKEAGDIGDRITEGRKLGDDDRKKLVELSRQPLQQFIEESDDRDTGEPETES